MGQPIHSTDELCVALEDVLARARDGEVPAWIAADVLAETAEDIRCVGYIPPQWGDE